VDLEFLKLFGLKLDLHWVSNIKDWIWIAKCDSPLISASDARYQPRSLLCYVVQVKVVKGIVIKIKVIGVILIDPSLSYSIIVVVQCSMCVEPGAIDLLLLYIVLGNVFVWFDILHLTL